MAPGKKKRHLLISVSEMSKKASHSETGATKTLENLLVVSFQVRRLVSQLLSERSIVKQI